MIKAVPDIRGKGPSKEGQTTPPCLLDIAIWASLVPCHPVPSVWSSPSTNSSTVSRFSQANSMNSRELGDLVSVMVEGY